MTVMTARAPKDPAKTSLRRNGYLSANSTAMKKVLSPSSEKKMRRKPETRPSLRGESPSSPAEYT